MAVALESVYAELSHPSEPSSANLFRPSQVFNVSQCRYRWHWIALWIGWAGNVILVVTVIVLAFQTRQLPDALEKSSVTQGPPNGTENNPCQEKMRHVRRFLCKPPDNNTAESSSCKLCPLNWVLHENKCYWVSEGKQTWHKSKEDCRAKRSRLMVIQNQEEVVFIQQRISKGAPMLWIGLEATSPHKTWMWVDGSPLDNKLLQLLGPAEANSCGKLNGNKTVAEACRSVMKWICETDALEI